MIEFDTYVRNYRREVIEALPKDVPLLSFGLVIVEKHVCDGTTYHRAKILSASSGVCRVSLNKKRLRKVKLIKFNNLV